jgi:hypothetical protein
VDSVDTQYILIGLRRIYWKFLASQRRADLADLLVKPSSTDSALSQRRFFNRLFRQPIGVAHLKMSTLWASLLLVFTFAPPWSHGAPKGIFLSGKSNVPAKDISRALEKNCPNVSLVDDSSKSDYTLDAIETASRYGIGIEHVEIFDLSLLDPDGVTVRGASTTSLRDGMKDLCRAMAKSIAFEVVDTSNLTLSSDVRGDTSHGLGGAVATSLTGRRTHTDAMTMYAIVKGEHALLDCYEHRTGCATIAPGKYYGEQDGDGIWVDYRMPVTHKPMRNHYKIAGSW